MSDQFKGYYEKLKEQPLLAWAFLIIIPLILLQMCNSAESEKKERAIVSDSVPTVEATPDITPETKQAVTDSLMSDEETIIKDVAWDDKGKSVLYIGVIDDNTNRDGLADYVCQVLLSDFDMAQGDVSVYIMDITKIAKGGEWVKLGESNCIYN